MAPIGIVAIFYAAMFIVGFALSGFVGSLVWPYTINSWLEVAGKDPAVLKWHGFLLGVIPGVGQAGILLCLVTWIMMLFL